MKHPKKHHMKFGLPPGALVHVGERKLEHVHMTLIDFDRDNLETKKIDSLDTAVPFRDTASVSWVNIDGLHDINVLEQAGKLFNIHPLILEDILNTHQRPKIEELENLFYCVLKMLDYNEDEQEIINEQVSLVLEQNFLISFQEKPGDVFDPIRERIKSSLGRIRRSGPDFLMYSLMDSVVDKYFNILEHLGERLEFLEESLLADPSKTGINEIYKLKRQLLEVRHAVWPLREAVGRLRHGTSSLIREETLTYVNDLYDHIIQVIDYVETYREMVAGMLDLYLSSVSNRMNEIMRVLTVIATIFIPLTFVAGIYGMNFRFMPELAWKWSYPSILVIMAGLGIFMVRWFRKKKWL